MHKQMERNELFFVFLRDASAILNAQGKRQSKDVIIKIIVVFFKTNIVYLSGCFDINILGIPNAFERRSRFLGFLDGVVIDVESTLVMLKESLED